ncbi:phage tail protein [uncultured Campylobacter sp.]|uniref:phage tail protein n=1 Tax=uncultured Campylobacter sp. TaxID=218934 RepID=UPI0026220BC9|nr:phage tail protein [uncultured Campylobacter sp.]
MLDLRAYNDALFRVDEVFAPKMDEYLAFDEHFFYNQTDINRAYLAHQFDTEPKSLSIDETKELLKAPLKTYFFEGTSESLEAGLKAYYSGASTKQWSEYGGEPYHFKLILDASKGLSKEQAAKTDKLIKTYKNVRSVYDGASIKATAGINLKAYSYTFIGESISVYPYVVSNINEHAHFKFGAATQINEIISIPIDAIRVLTR